VEAYEKLVERDELIDDVVADLEDYVEHWPDVDLMQTLGDAYMRADRLQDALDTYRQALASL
jgi:cytochrome c-type biogenesis protein CcmH/NrfG